MGWSVLRQLCLHTGSSSKVVHLYNQTLSQQQQQQQLRHVLAVVEDDGAVGPAVMVDQTQVGEQTHTHSLQASLITQSESITLDLKAQRGQDGVRERSEVM